MISTVAYDTELIQPSYDQIDTMTFSHLNGEVTKVHVMKDYGQSGQKVRQLVKSQSLKVRCLQGPLLQIDGYRTTACKEQI